MKREIITIEKGIVTVPHKVRMNIAEIAHLFDIFYQTAKRNIRTIEKSGIAGGDNSMGGSVEGMKVYPDYYGLEMIIALSFQIKSRNAEVFRDWLLKKAAKTEMSKMLIMYSEPYIELSIFSTQQLSELIPISLFQQFFNIRRTIQDFSA